MPRFLNKEMTDLAAVTVPKLHGECSVIDDDNEDDEARSHALHSIRCHSFVRILNPDDRWCLARAINIGLKYWECGQQRTPEFMAHCLNQQAHGPDVERLLSDAGIETTKQQYGIDDAMRIQQLLQQRYGADAIRLCIFSHEARNALIWKGWTGRPAHYNLALFHEASHFSFVGEVKQLLKV